MKTKHFLPLAFFAVAFTLFACSSDDGGNTGETKYDYCITAENTCLVGPFTVNTCNGQPSNSCPYDGSSSSINGSSSSGNGSSSSITVSNSSSSGGSSSSVNGSSSSGNSSSSSITVSNSSSSGGSSSSSSSGYGAAGKGRDISNYKTVKIGEQNWMAENLNYATTNSTCYNNDAANCDKYGRRYGDNDAHNVCPDGWHLPSSAEWQQLIKFVEDDKGCTNCADKYLKAKAGWDSYTENVWNGITLSYDTYTYSGNGTDDYGFAALPGGVRCSGISDIGKCGSWWTSDMGTYTDVAFIVFTSGEQRISYTMGSNGGSGRIHSVRCVQDVQD
ncbi:MAG: hypothetical protein LBU89_11195 [Fibromonadaceae bacterium]|nr:hypothetical protein [Fibromonadaceae bacterium]